MRQFREQKLLVATHNAGKLAEMRALFGPKGIEVVGAQDFGLAEPPETEDSFLGNARIKARAAVAATGIPALADDSGICVDGLGGAPGVYTADWAETPNGRNYLLAMTRTWDALEAANAPFPRNAQFTCTLVLAWPDGHEEVFSGEIKGQLVWPPRGEEGHGYDPIFQPDGYDVTMGEMSAELKNSLSHRARAVEALLAGCFEADA